MMRHREPLHSSGYGHMADGIRAEPAVHRTACSSFAEGIWQTVTSARPGISGVIPHGLAQAWLTRSAGPDNAAWAAEEH